MTCEELDDLLALDALGMLNGAEKKTLDDHLAGCADCRRTREALVETAAMLSYAVAAPVPSGLKGRLKERVAPKRQTPRAWGWQAACVLLALGLLATASGLVAARRELAAARSQNAALTASAAELRDRLAVLETPDLKLASLSGQAPAPGAEARLFWSPDKQAWLLTFFDLPTLKEGQTYQLWAITPDQKLSLGTLGEKAAGTVMFKATPPKTNEPLQAVAVSIEPAGGVPQPTGPIALLGKL